MKNILASFAFLVFMLFTFSNLSLAQDKKAPEFSLKSVEGKTVKFSDYKNKIVLIDFWATWCPPCRKGIPDLIELQKEFKNDLVVLGISVDTDTKPDVLGFIKNYGINYTVVYGDQATAKLFGGVSGIPTSFLIDRRGNIVDKHVGLVPKGTLAAGIKSLLKK